MLSIAWILFRQRILEAGLPDISRDGSNLLIIQTEIRHLGGGPEVGWFLKPYWNPVPVQFQPDVFQVRSNFFHVLQQAVRLEIELLNVAIDLAVGNFQRYGVIIQPIGFLVGLGSVGLLHQLSRLLGILCFLGFELLDLLADRVQVFGFLVVALVTMAADAPSLPEEIFAFADVPSHIAADQNHICRVANLAAGFSILFGEERPQPVLVISVTFFDASSGTAIALVTGRAAKFLRIVNLQ